MDVGGLTGIGAYCISSVICITHNHCPGAGIERPGDIREYLFGEIQVWLVAIKPMNKIVTVVL
jgi:hypothetical protein